MKRFAELECIYLKQCIRTNCTQEKEIGENGAKTFNIKLQRLSTPRKMTPPRPMPLQSVPRRNSSENARNLVSQDIVKREVQLALQRVNVGYATKTAEETSSPLPDIPNPATTGNIVRFTNQSKPQEGFGTVPNENAVEPATLPMSSSYFGINVKHLIATLFALVVILAILALISVTLLIACWRRKSGHHQSSCCTVTCCVNNIYRYQPVPDDTTPQTGKTVKKTLIV